MKPLLGFLFILFIGVVLPIAATVWSGGLDNTREAESHREGYDAGKARIPVEACPEFQADRVRAWKRGWIEGRKGAP